MKLPITSIQHTAVLQYCNPGVEASIDAIRLNCATVFLLKKSLCFSKYSSSKAGRSASAALEASEPGLRALELQGQGKGAMHVHSSLANLD